MSAISYFATAISHTIPSLQPGLSPAQLDIFLPGQFISALKFRFFRQTGEFQRCNCSLRISLHSLSFSTEFQTLLQWNWISVIEWCFRKYYKKVKLIMVRMLLEAENKDLKLNSNNYNVSQSDFLSLFYQKRNEIWCKLIWATWEKRLVNTTRQCDPHI